MPYLVAQTHKREIDACVVEVHERAGDVVAEGCGEWVESVGPFFRGGLFGGVGPVVGEVVVEVDFVAFVVEALGEGDCVV